MRSANIGQLVLALVACGGSERGRPAPSTEGSGVEVGIRPDTGDDAVQIGGGQTSDFGDGVESACDYPIEPLAREAALAEGWPVDSDLELFAPDVQVELERQGVACQEALDDAGALRLQSQLVGINVGRGELRSDLVGVVDIECGDSLTYGVDIAVEATNGWIAGLIHVELYADTSAGAALVGNAIVPADSLRGSLGLLVDRSRPHEASAKFHVEFARSGVRGWLWTEANYLDALDGRQPLVDEGERLDWPALAGSRCTPVAPDADGSSSEWLSLDEYRALSGAP